MTLAPPAFEDQAHVFPQSILKPRHSPKVLVRCRGGRGSIREGAHHYLLDKALQSVNPCRADEYHGHHRPCVTLWTSHPGWDRLRDLIFYHPVSRKDFEGIGPFINQLRIQPVFLHQDLHLVAADEIETLFKVQCKTCQSLHFQTRFFKKDLLVVCCLKRTPARKKSSDFWRQLRGQMPENASCCHFGPNTVNTG